MPTVAAAFVNAMARAAGLTLSDDGRLLSGADLVYRFERTPQKTITDNEHFDALERIRSHFGDDLALMRAYSDMIELDDLGVLGLAVKTAPDLRSVLSVIERFFALMTDTVVYRFDSTGDPASLSIVAQTGRHAALPFRNECALLGFSKKIRMLTGSEIALDHISFAHKCTGDPARYADHFGCDVLFQQTRDAVWLSAEALDLPVLRGDKGVSNFLIAHLEQELSSLDSTNPLMAELMRHVSGALQHGLPQAADIARAMGMSERTFYRRLSDEGLTYREVLQQAQSELARELLSSSNRSIAEIAFLTGFSEQSAFSRAFKRWAGLAPAQYRQKPGSA